MKRFIFIGFFCALFSFVTAHDYAPPSYDVGIELSQCIVPISCNEEFLNMISLRDYTDADFGSSAKTVPGYSFVGIYEDGRHTKIIR